MKKEITPRRKMEDDNNQKKIKFIKRKEWKMNA